MSIPYAVWHVQREDLYHARHVSHARASVKSHQDHTRSSVDNKKIMDDKQKAIVIDRDNQFLLERLQKIHSRPDSGWNKSHLFESLSPQFRRQLAQVRSGQRAALKNKNYHDKRRIEAVTAKGDYGNSSKSSSVRLPQRPSGLRKARRLKNNAQRKLIEQSTESTKPETNTITNIDSSLNQTNQLDQMDQTNRINPRNQNRTKTGTQYIDNNIWKLVYRSGTRLDMMDPNQENAILLKKSNLCIVTMWRFKNHKTNNNGFGTNVASGTKNKILIVCEDLKTMSKKSLLLRAHHIKYMMTMKDPNTTSTNSNNNKNKKSNDDTNDTNLNQFNKRRNLDSRGWDHAVQIPQFANTSFDALSYHLGQFNNNAIGEKKRHQ